MKKRVILTAGICIGISASLCSCGSGNISDKLEELEEITRELNEENQAEDEYNDLEDDTDYDSEDYENSEGYSSESNISSDDWEFMYGENEYDT